MAKTPRADFALPGGRFPLNTPGRKAAAPGLAAYSEKKGNISPAQEAAVDRKAVAALPVAGPVMGQGRHAGKTTCRTCLGMGEKNMNKCPTCKGAGFVMPRG